MSKGLLSSPLAVIGCAIAALLLVAWAYAPGLHGAFLFDDGANLPTIGAAGPVDNFSTLIQYLTSGRADPLGRPVSLLSFLIDARDWPADPFAFKRTNLVIHLLNGVLLGVVMLRLGLELGTQATRNRIAALLSATLWTIHPFFVSTVMYVVQREAMLPATFTLLGILLWLRGRHVFPTAPSSGRLWIVLGVGACTVLATLSKANGLLLPLLILVIEAILPRRKDDKPYLRTLGVTLGPIAVAICGFLVWHAITGLSEGPVSFRGWSVGQRLLTEPSVLLDYLSQLLLIKPGDSSLLHDDIAVATSLWQPWYVVPSVIFCLLAVIFAWRVRHTCPSLALAIMFFFAGHLMESTSLALELYFDHRNYVPAMFLFWPIGMAVARVKPSLSWFAGLATVAVVTGLALLTHASASLWGNPLAQSQQWAERHPGSARAQAYAAQLEADAGLTGQARRRIDAASTHFSDEPQIAFNLVNLHCATGGIGRQELAYARESLRSAQREPGPLLVNWFESAVDTAHHGSCPGLTSEALSELLDAALANPRIADIAGRRQDILHIRGTLSLAGNDPDAALAWFDRALAESSTPQAALNQAAALGQAGFPSHGLRHLRYFSSLRPQEAHTWRDGMPWIHEQILERQGYWPHEIAHLRGTLSADIQKASP